MPGERYFEDLTISSDTVIGTLQAERIEGARISLEQAESALPGGFLALIYERFNTTPEWVGQQQAHIEEIQARTRATVANIETVITYNRESVPLLQAFCDPAPEVEKPPVPAELTEPLGPEAEPSNVSELADIVRRPSESEEAEAVTGHIASVGGVFEEVTPPYRTHWQVIFNSASVHKQNSGSVITSTLRHLGFRPEHFQADTSMAFAGMAISRAVVPTPEYLRQALRADEPSTIAAMCVRTGADALVRLQVSVGNMKPEQSDQPRHLRSVD